MSSTIFPLIAARVEPGQRHLIAPATLQADLGFEMVDLWGLGDDIERELGVEFEDGVVEAWASVADIVASVSAREVVA